MNNERMQFHPDAALFPMMSQTELAALCADVEKNGLREAIFLAVDPADGIEKIADGRNRYEACVAAGITPSYRKWDGKGDLVSIVVSLNLKRRHLSPSQLAMVAGKLANMRQGERSDLSEVSGRLSQEAAAKMFNVSADSVGFAKKVLRDGAPELIAEVEAGEISVSGAAEFAEMPQSRQKRIIKQGRNKTKKIISRIRERSLANASKGGRHCVVCLPNVEDTDENFLAAIQLVGEQFPLHQRFLTDVVEELAQTELSDDTREAMEKITSAIRRGFSEHTDCRRASGLDWDHFDVTITHLLDYGMIEVKYQGGKHDEARGARKKIYVITDRPMPEPKDDDDDEQDSWE